MEQIALNKRAAIPQPRRKRAVPAAVRAAAQEYKAAYKSLFGVEPALKWEQAGQWVRIKGQAQGVSVRRLKELTAQLKARKG